jgi:hypothetical protein
MPAFLLSKIKQLNINQPIILINVSMVLHIIRMTKYIIPQNKIDEAVDIAEKYFELRCKDQNTNRPKRPDGTYYNKPDMILGFIGEIFVYGLAGMKLEIDYSDINYSTDIILGNNEYNIKTTTDDFISINQKQNRRHCKNYIGVRVYGFKLNDYDRNKSGIIAGNEIELIGEIEQNKINDSMLKFGDSWYYKIPFNLLKPMPYLDRK